MKTVSAFAVTAVSLSLLSGCHVTEQKNGDNKNVSIGTPFGSMQVKTNDKADASAIGIAVYPGATPYKEDADSKGGSADVNLSFGDFHLGVKAASYITPDPQDKVLAFYKTDLAKYGTVIECHGGQAIGEPTRTAQGLTCSDSHNGGHIETKDDGGKGFSIHGTLNGHDVNEHGSDAIELRTGSEQHQHIVGVSQRDGGTKIGLVALDLPGHLGSHGKDDVE